MIRREATTISGQTPMSGAQYNANSPNPPLGDPSLEAGLTASPPPDPLALPA